MTNKVKPFFIRITDDMTSQMVQDAFDKCVDAGAIANDGVKIANRKHQYEKLYGVSFDFFGVDSGNNTYIAVVGCAYGESAKEITLDQLDEWLGLEVEEEWDGKGLPPIGTKCEVMFTLDATPKWYQCTIDYSCQDVGVLDIEGEKCAFTTAPTNGHSVKFRKPETPEQKAERERQHAVYDMCGDLDNHTDDAKFWCEKLYDAGYRKQ